MTRIEIKSSIIAVRGGGIRIQKLFDAHPKLRKIKSGGSFGRRPLGDATAALGLGPCYSVPPFAEEQLPREICLFQLQDHIYNPICLPIQI